MNQLLTGLLLSSIMGATSLYGHGEDHPGPNGGFVKMPGAFHTELVPEGEKNIKVYLLDMGFQNPMTKGSTVSAKMTANGKNLDITCTAQVDFFKCALPVKLSAALSGKIVIEAERDGKKGVPATYNLPLKRK